VLTVNGPRREHFLKLVRSHVEKKPGCDPLDGQLHSLEEVTRWIGIRELALRFIGLGVALGVFQLAAPWKRDREESHESMIKRLAQEDGARFLLSDQADSAVELPSAHPGSRSRPYERGKAIIVTSSAELTWAKLPSSSATMSAHHRPFSRSGRRFAYHDLWPTTRFERPRRGSQGLGEQRRG
jgi:hypothetical protein